MNKLSVVDREHKAVDWEYKAVDWEYKVVKVGPSSSLMSEALLNELGRAGWDLVAFQPLDQRAYPGEGAFYLKRQRRGQTS